ncbi:rho guanine nucleotide exchange factor 28 [Chanos chanos]|uniref:Rho guanine nucleotide exchange factor 28 n=1 Tax=Chanos chanos TaxID=29144 RepID=A0A6J2WGG2_CHACN|nr:rho guanine nucleotide exchange factor 28 [Chanos chanos]
MELSKRELPVYGQEEVFVTLERVNPVPEGPEYYVILEGSSLSHITSAQRSPDGLFLRFIVPGHNRPESVTVEVYLYDDGDEIVPLSQLAKLSLEYQRDQAQEAAETLISDPHYLLTGSYREALRELCQGDKPLAGQLHQLDGGKVETSRLNETSHLIRWSQRPANSEEWSTFGNGVSMTGSSSFQGLGFGELNLQQGDLERRVIQALSNMEYPQEWNGLGAQGRKGSSWNQSSFGSRWVCVDSSRLLRFYPLTGSVVLTVRHDTHSRTHTDTHANVHFYRDRLRDQDTITQMTKLKRQSVKMKQEMKRSHGHGEESCAGGLTNLLNIEEHTLVDSVFEEQLVLSLDEEEEDLNPFHPEKDCSSLLCGELQFDSTHSAAARLTAMLSGKAPLLLQDDDLTMKYNVAGVTADCSPTDGMSWPGGGGVVTLPGATDTPPPSEGEEAQLEKPSSFPLSPSLSSSPLSTSSPAGLALNRFLCSARHGSAIRSGSSTPSCDLSPSLVALEMDSEDDDDEVLIKKPLPQMSSNPKSSEDIQEANNSTPNLTCTRSYSASSANSHTPSKESAEQGIRLRSYSYSSPKIGLLPPRFSRDAQPPTSDLTHDDAVSAVSSSSGSRSLLQALSLSKSLSLLNPVKQRAFSFAEQPQEKREFRRRVQLADDEASVELVDSLQHLTLSEFLKEIEEEEWDKYIIPSKAESEKYKVSRTFSFIKSRMYSTRNKSKGKAKDKEREKEGKDRQTNGHQFSSGPCSGHTACVVCEKPATGKELLHCSNCSQSVHKGCRELASPCLRKFQDKYAVSLVKNRTASLPQNFTMGESSSTSLMSSSSSLPVMTPRDRRDGATPACPLSRSVPTASERFSESPEGDTDPSTWKNHIQTGELLHNIESSPSTSSSLTEDTPDGPLQSELEAQTISLGAESWSLAVDPEFCKAQEKCVIKRQDVIYELMQTELHHVQTLTIMAEVFRRGMREEVQLDPEVIGRIFPCLDELLLLHRDFLCAMWERRNSSSYPDSDRNYIITHIGDILLQQFSQESAEKMKQVYGEFCSHHTEAVTFFKELQQQNKRFQLFIKQQSSNSLVKRREIPECILLVTQRITKYPVLLERILQYTQQGTEEHEEVSRALVLIRELIAAVDLQVSEYEQGQRLLDVLNRMENKSSAKLKNGHTFRKQDITSGRTLIHHGPLQWKTATGRLKDVLALLLTDTLVFLQEKDQKYSFATVDQKPPVISLQKLIVREVANEERGMFLISASAAGPEMYEVHTASKDERNTWMRLIREAVESCPEEEDETTSESEEERRVAEARVQKINKLQESLSSYDEQICSSLEEKLHICSEFWSMRGNEQNWTEPRLLVRPNTDDAPQATTLLNAALKEAENLKSTLSSHFCASSSALLRLLSEMIPSADPECGEVSSSHHEPTSPDTHRSEEESLSTTDTHNTITQVTQSVQSLTQLLYSLQAAVTIQDSFYEVQRLLLLSTSNPRPRQPSSGSLRGPALQEQERQREAELRRAELVGVARMREALAQEKQRWERECLAREHQQGEVEKELEQREKQCHLEAQRLQREREELEEQLQDYQQSLERLREGQRSVERERERLELQQDLLQNLKHNRQCGLPAMLIPLDGLQDSGEGQSLGQDADGLVFMNEAAFHGPALNNRHHQHYQPHNLGSLAYQDSPSAHNSLESLLAHSNHRYQSPSGHDLGWTGRLSASQAMGTEHINHDLGTQGHGYVVWSPGVTGAGIHQSYTHGLTGDALLDSQALVPVETELGEEGGEENIVYL